jgi:hypothetical protein
MEALSNLSLRSVAFLNAIQESFVLVFAHAAGLREEHLPHPCRVKHHPSVLVEHIDRHQAI